MVYINIKLSSIFGEWRKGVFHTIHRFFHSLKWENPLQIGSLQGVTYIFSRFLKKSLIIFLVYRTPDFTRVKPRKKLQVLRKLQVCGEDPMGLGGVHTIRTNGIYSEDTAFLETPGKVDLLSFPGFCQIAQSDALNRVLLMETAGQQVIHPV